jgi:predicted PhzF superfamily epimerase YddE/YHI9
MKTKVYIANAFTDKKFGGNPLAVPYWNANWWVSVY